MRRYRDRSRHDLIPPHRTGRADFPHPALSIAVAIGMHRQLCGRTSQAHQAHTLEVLIVGHPFRRLKGPLAATAHVLREPPTYEGIDLPEGHAGVSQSEVVCPADELLVDLTDQPRQRLRALRLVDPLTQCLSLACHGLLRGLQVEIPTLSSVEVAVVSKRELKNVQARSLLPEVNQSRLL